ncbi:hypothetical protein NEOLEDRAFT_1171173 [Neolentinus lepideus HHB14362 ss-1]|uniref:Uncharacterized protein n=1 Tax=Neolentinus lepideus HHB14362 ss-1 TaxID=1314782 RepID=A0A165QQN7_9AGAM|nr:hypothetical protein NEOLEDRAFT_1171173 [Neolentinus lepideus HHB14362 ss-1]
MVIGNASVRRSNVLREFGIAMGISNCIDVLSRDITLNRKVQTLMSCLNWTLDCNGEPIVRTPEWYGTNPLSSGSLHWVLDERLDTSKPAGACAQRSTTSKSGMLSTTGGLKATVVATSPSVLTTVKQNAWGSDWSLFDAVSQSNDSKSDGR